MNTTMESNRKEPLPVGSDAVLGWLYSKLSEAQRALRCREAMANPPTISDEEWERLKSSPGARVTKGRNLSKAVRLEIELAPVRHRRIAVKCRHEVEMFEALILLVESLQKSAPPVADD